MAYRVGIVGAGVGREHALALAALPDHFQIAAVCDLDPVRSERLAREFRAGMATTSLDAFLADDFDIVDVCTWPNTHYGIALRALEAGKHVICEKPLAGSLRQAADLCATADRLGRILMPIFQFRYGRGLARLKHLVDRGIAGAPVLSTIETSWMRDQSYYDNPRRGRRDSELGGVCVSQAIHAHDALTYIMGPVASVAANTATRIRDIEVENTLSATLVMHNGSLASISACLASAVEISRFRFVFEHLTAESSTLPYNPASEPWSIQATSDDAAAAVKSAMADFEEEPELYVGQFRRLALALGGNADPPVTMADAYRSLELATAIYHSAATGERVQLPLTPQHALYEGW